MTADIPHRTLPVAQISRAALQQNLQGHPKELFVDVAHDARGHGEEVLADVARDEGYAGLVLAGGDAVAFAGAVPDAFTALTPAASLGWLPGTRPALRLVGRVLSVKALRAGEGVSYGYTHRAEADTRIALVTGGYAQGIVRSLGNRLRVAVGGQRRPIVGRVAMDVAVVDLGEVEVQTGDEVVFLGDPAYDEPGIAEWTGLTGLSAEEIVITIGMRARREIVA